MERNPPAVIQELVNCMQCKAINAKEHLLKLLPCGHELCRSCAYDWIQKNDNCFECNIPYNLELMVQNEREKPDSIECAYCNSTFPKERTTTFIPCGHTFCRVCTYVWLSKNEECYICGKLVDLRKMLPNKDINESSKADSFETDKPIQAKSPGKEKIMVSFLLTAPQNTPVKDEPSPPKASAFQRGLTTRQTYHNGQAQRPVRNFTRQSLRGFMKKDTIDTDDLGERLTKVRAAGEKTEMKKGSFWKRICSKMK